MSKLKLILGLVVAVMGATIWIQTSRIQSIKEDRDRQAQNTDALISQIKQWQVDSTTMATDAKALRLTINEMERYRAADIEKIKNMGIKIKNLEAAARHNMEINAEINAKIKDTVFIQDLTPVKAEIIKYKTPHLTLEGIISEKHFSGTINMPITLRQAVWVEYKRRWIFWKRAVGVHQTITTDNPHAHITYSEYIKIEK